MNILLVRPDGIGDEILSLPVATELRRAMPESRLSFLSSVYAAKSFDNDLVRLAGSKPAVLGEGR